MGVQQSPLSCSQGSLSCIHLPLLGLPQGVNGGAHHPKPSQHQGKLPDSPKQRGLCRPFVSCRPFGHAFSLCTCCDLPQAKFMWVPVASTNPASVLPSCCVRGPAHAHPIPKELSLVVELPLGVSWLFPRNEALVVCSKALGVLCFAGTGQAAEPQLLPHS